MHVKFQSEISKGKDHVEESGVVSSVPLNWDWKKLGGTVWIRLFWLKNFKINFSSFMNKYKINVKLHFLNGY